MKKNNGLKKFGLGVVAGAFLGVLFAPKKGLETRKELREKLNMLVDKAKNTSKEDIKNAIENKVKDIQESIDDLSTEKVYKVAKSKAKKLEDKVYELSKYIAEKGEPALEKTIASIKRKTNLVIDDALKKLEK